MFKVLCRCKTCYFNLAAGLDFAAVICITAFYCQLIYSSSSKSKITAHCSFCCLELTVKGEAKGLFLPSTALLNLQVDEYRIDVYVVPVLKLLDSDST